MGVLALLLGLVAFIAVLRLCHARDVAARVLGTTQSALAAMANGDYSEEEKEARVKRASLTLLVDFFRLLATATAALAASALIVWGGDLLGLYSLDAALRIAVGWPFLLGSSLAAIGLWLLLDRLHPPDAENTDREQSARADVPYGPLDKALHDYAFASPQRQKRLGDLENRLYRRRLDLDAARRPVFVTSLPRAGTTILLELLAGLPQFASATYRHMPFTLAPLLWGGFSDRFRKTGGTAERAHGDGMEVGIDSPEAFEEMLWMTFWPGHYGKTITPWTEEDRDPEFEAFLRTHMAKIVRTKPGASRYLSKNNANIARLGLLETLFADATILVPIRNPRAQVRSLMRQHRRFGELHAREPFARRYMEGIGHLEFGQALRPIAFDTMMPESDEAGQAAFWLHYWVSAYEHVLDTAGAHVVFVDHDALCAAPTRHLLALAAAIGLPDPGPLIARADILHAPRPVPSLPDVPAELLARADILHSELCRLAMAPLIGSTKEVLRETIDL